MPETTTIEGSYALNLAGWECYSIWGLDPMETTYGLFAQLWRNTDDPTLIPGTGSAEFRTW